MRTLVAFLCLTFAVLLFSAGEAWSLPKCPGSYNQNTWHNCFGIGTTASGNKYVGEFRDGKYHGQGTFTHTDGGKYVGEWRDGERNGQGTFTFANGDKYVGEFRDDLPNGQGTFTYADGSVKEGVWKDGKLQP